MKQENIKKFLIGFFVAGVLMLAISFLYFSKTEKQNLNPLDSIKSTKEKVDPKKDIIQDLFEYSKGERYYKGQYVTKVSTSSVIYLNDKGQKIVSQVSKVYLPNYSLVSSKLGIGCIKSYEQPCYTKEGFDTVYLSSSEPILSIEGQYNINITPKILNSIEREKLFNLYNGNKEYVFSLSNVYLKIVDGKEEGFYGDVRKFYSSVKSEVVSDLNLDIKSLVGEVYLSDNNNFVSYGACDVGCGYGVAKKINGKWVQVTTGQEIQNCDTVNKYQIPLDITPICWDNFSNKEVKNNIR